MHRVLNYGSALQAYALQTTMEKLGHACNLIDYQYPYVDSGSNSLPQRLLTFLNKWVRRLLRLCSDPQGIFHGRIRRNAFIRFYRERYKLTSYYRSHEELSTNPPSFDLYVTGSDQVWNYNYMKGDSVFFCDFIQNGAPRIAYSASFAISDISGVYAKTYGELLRKYTAIGVREKGAVDIVRNLSQKEAIAVCDPSLLLSVSDYSVLSKRSTIRVHEPYLLVYILDYQFNPHPLIEDIIDRISTERHLRVVYLCGAAPWRKVRNAVVIDQAGPNEFVYLFKHASFVVTSSFHGVAFSLLFKRQVYGVVESTEDTDRAGSLFRMVGAESNAIPATSTIDSFIESEIDYTAVSPLLEQYKKRSLDFLRESITSCESLVSRSE